jgi:hypothetical protein
LILSWIDPLMKHQGLAYRVSLLRAAAFHGSSHQAAMVIQVIAPKQLRDFEIGRHRLQFLYQAPQIFSHVYLAARLGQMKSDEGFAKVEAHDQRIGGGRRLIQFIAEFAASVNALDTAFGGS